MHVNPTPVSLLWKLNIHIYISRSYGSLKTHMIIKYICVCTLERAVRATFAQVGRHSPTPTVTNYNRIPPLAAKYHVIRQYHAILPGFTEVTISIYI